MTKVVKVNDMTIVMGNLSKQKNVALSVLIPVIFELLFHWSCLSWILTRKRKKKKNLISSHFIFCSRTGSTAAQSLLDPLSSEFSLIHCGL